MNTVKSKYFLFILFLILSITHSECLYSMQFLERGTKSGYRISVRHLKSRCHLFQPPLSRAFSEPINGSKYSEYSKKLSLNIQRDNKIISLQEDRSPFNQDFEELMIDNHAIPSSNQGKISEETTGLTEAAKKNYSKASLELGFNVEQQAVEWLRKSAAQGMTEAQLILGIMYDIGQGVQKDKKKASEWYRLAAEQGNAYAQINLGSMYKNGEGVPQDYVEAFKWYQLAAEQNQPMAFYFWAYLQNKGIRSGQYIQSQVLYQKAFKLYTQTDSHEILDVQNALGIMYQCGRGIEKDLYQAFEWYKKSAEQNDDYGQANLGRMYKEGLGIEKNLEKALAWINRSVEQECVLGYYHLALMYRDGEGVQRDDNIAIALLNKAAAEKHAESLYTLGWMIEQGRGEKCDLKKAQQYYEEGRQRLAEDALYSIGRIFQYGLGGEKIDLLEAKKWYQKASDVHYEPAIEKLKDLRIDNRS